MILHQGQTHRSGSLEIPGSKSSTSAEYGHFITSYTSNRHRSLWKQPAGVSAELGLTGPSQAAMTQDSNA